MPYVIANSLQVDIIDLEANTHMEVPVILFTKMGHKNIKRTLPSRALQWTSLCWMMKGPMEVPVKLVRIRISIMQSTTPTITAMFYVG